jgi:catechol 2,3-dioxygenase-like lactoylglutathione lyase family enzyme
MQLFRVLIPVRDIDAAARFYGALLELTGSRVSPGRHYFDCGGTILACFDPRADGEGYEARANPECIYLSTDDIDAAYSRAEKLGVQFATDAPPEVGAMGEIADRPWGERSFYFSDPFDNPLCIVATDTVFRGPSEDEN